MTVEFEQIVNGTSLYLNNLVIKNNATTPNTKLDVAAGICRDSLNQIDMNIGNFEGINPGSANVVTVLNFGVNGLNGLDTGVLQATKIYYIYAISDPSNFRPSGVIASLALPSVGPLMPFGYGLQRWIGCWSSDGAVHLFKGYYSGMNNEKSFYYDAPQASDIVAGASAVYAPAKLTNLAPLLAYIPLLIQTNMAANAAGDVLNMQPIVGTGDSVTIISQVAAGVAHLVNYNKVLSGVVVTDVEINYKISAGAVAINIAGYDLSL